MLLSRKPDDIKKHLTGLRFVKIDEKNSMKTFIMFIVKCVKNKVKVYPRW